MSRKPDDLTAAAVSGYTGPGTNPFIATSPSWYAYGAGETLSSWGTSTPVKARMSRGSSVRIWTAANEYRVTFDKDGAPNCRRV